MSESQECIGTITEIDSSEILLEFQDQTGSRSVASVKIDEVKSGSRRIKVGDKLKCALVLKKENEQVVIRAMVETINIQI
jgi:hypothetical protein